MAVLTLALLQLAGWGGQVQAAVVEGVRFSERIQSGDVDLGLRGARLLRYMVFIKAYVAAFYLPEGTPSAEALADVPKHLEIEYFHAIAAPDFAKATRSGIARNVSMMGSEKIKPAVEELNALYRDIKPGDRYSLTYLPGQGTTLALNGTALGTVAGADFAAGLFAIWIGSAPLDEGLKQILLGDG
ncbi:MAG: chalcone isomerase family protein [Desulfobacterales bacterium]